jgi:hypothetical protein
MPFFKTKDPTVPPGQTVTDGFPVLHVGDVPRFDPATWRLRFFGLCANPFELTWDELRALPTRRMARRHPLRHALVQTGYAVARRPVPSAGRAGPTRGERDPRGAARG